jgi:hypothetical protein
MTNRQWQMANEPTPEPQIPSRFTPRLANSQSPMANGKAHAWEHSTLNSQPSTSGITFHASHLASRIANHQGQMADQPPPGRCEIVNNFLKNL